MTAARALGVAAALAWLALALDVGAQWPRTGLVALGVSLAVAVALQPIADRVPRLLLAAPRPAFLGVVAVAAAVLSAWTVHRAMRDQPLSIDAGVYVLQARVLAHGHLGLPAPHPFQAFGDRFLLEGPDRRLYGIFPPGWPLALAPFVALGVPMAAGPAVAILLVLAQASLGRAVGRAAGDEDAGELATRASLLLSLASIGRALETADLLSHAFVAALAAFAVAGALGLDACTGHRRRLHAAAIGVCVSWVVASRLLDGVVLAGAVAGVLVWKRTAWRASGWITAGASPLLLLLLVEQHAATGAWLAPTQTLYFARSDWPPTCHRLGLGMDVGCTVEHPGPTARLGADGYDLHDALGVTRERARAIGEDLVGWPPLLLVAFVPLAVFASGVDAVLVAFVLALTLAYGLFYYGNPMFFGARHLFPAAAFAWLLVARGATALERGARRPGVGLAVILVTAVVAVRAPWKERTAGAAEFQAPRSDLRRTLAVQDVHRGILKTRDLTSYAAALDPWGDPQRLVALDDGAGLLELRRQHPDLPVLLSLPGDAVGRLYLGPPAAAGVRVELETLWPTFVVPHAIASRQSSREGASGGLVLLLSHATPGASIELPFEIATPGTYALRLGAFTGPDHGDYALELDGDPLPVLHGFAPAPGIRDAARVTRALDARRHVLVARCVGRDPASTGYDAELDFLDGIAPQ